PHCGTKGEDTAKRVPNPDGAVDPLRVQQANDSVGVRVEMADLAGQGLRAPMPGQVGDEDAVLPRELGRDAAPVLDRPTETVNQNHGRTVPRNRVAKPRIGHDELALIEFVKTVFALRHHLGIFFGQWMFCRSRPSEACSPYNRGYELTRGAVC